MQRLFDTLNSNPITTALLESNGAALPAGIGYSVAAFVCMKRAHLLHYRETKVVYEHFHGAATSGREVIDRVQVETNGLRVSGYPILLPQNETRFPEKIAMQPFLPPFPGIQA